MKTEALTLSISANFSSLILVKRLCLLLIVRLELSQLVIDEIKGSQSIISQFLSGLPNEILDV